MSDRVTATVRVWRTLIDAGRIERYRADAVATLVAVAEELLAERDLLAGRLDRAVDETTSQLAELRQVIQNLTPEIGQRTAMAFPTEAQAIADARTRGTCTVTGDDRGNYWSIPLERFAAGGVKLAGPWNGFQVETDQAGAIARPNLTAVGL